jgi:hypothetical protein
MEFAPRQFVDATTTSLCYFSTHIHGYLNMAQRPLLIALAAMLAAIPQTGGGTIQGRVTREDGTTPIPGVRITLATAEVDSETLKTLQSAAAARGVLVIPPGGDGPNPGAFLRGQIDTAISRGTAFATSDLQPALDRLRTAGEAVPLNAVSDSDGRFQMRNASVVPGTYDLFARVTDPTVASGNLSAAFSRIPIDIGTQDISGVSEGMGRLRTRSHCNCRWNDQCGGISKPGPLTSVLFTP